MAKGDDRTTTSSRLIDVIQGTGAEETDTSDVVDRFKQFLDAVTPEDWAEEEPPTTAQGE
jgi:hypothetical protein